MIVGIFLLAPLGIGVLRAGAGLRLPVAIRIALRDLIRYRARSGAALAAVTFAMFLATVICLVGSERYDNPLSPSGPNLSASQLVVVAGRGPSAGMMMQLTSAQTASLGGGSIAWASACTRGPPCHWNPPHQAWRSAPAVPSLHCC